MRYYLSLLLLIVLYISSSSTCQGRSLPSQFSNFCSPNNSVRDACYVGLKHPICFLFTSLSLFPYIYLIILIYRVLTLLFTSQKTVDYHSSIFQSKAWVSLSHLYVTSFNLFEKNIHLVIRSGKLQIHLTYLALFSKFELQYIKQFSPFDEKPATGFFLGSLRRILFT